MSEAIVLLERISDLIQQSRARKKNMSQIMGTVPPHPWAIKPLGNAFGAKHNIKTAAGLFAVLPDELILQIFELLGPESILRLGATCKALCAFSRFEELWKTKFIE